MMYGTDLWTEIFLQVCAYPHSMTASCAGLVATSSEYLTWLLMEQPLQAGLRLGFSEPQSAQGYEVDFLRGQKGGAELAIIPILTTRYVLEERAGHEVGKPGHWHRYWHTTFSAEYCHEP
jgi:hypothetical protein